MKRTKVKKIKGMDQATQTRVEGCSATPSPSLCGPCGKSTTKHPGSQKGTTIPNNGRGGRVLQTAKEFEKKFTTLPSLQINSVNSGGAWDLASPVMPFGRSPQDNSKMAPSTYKVITKDPSTRSQAWEVPSRD